ncbi:MAG: hypothetical protein V1709_11880 [Planctomycetota bacterium]
MQSRVEKVKSFDLKGKPVTEKLFSRAAKIIDNSMYDLKKMFPSNELNDIQDDNTIESFAITSTSVVIQEINKEVLKRNDIEERVLLTNVLTAEKSKETLPHVVLFTYWCTMAISRLIEDEGIKLNGTDLIQGVLSPFVILEDDKERIKQIQKGRALLFELIDTKSDNVLGWFNNLLNVVLVYLMSFENNKNISEEDNIALINILFQKMISVYK